MTVVEVSTGYTPRPLQREIHSALRVVRDGQVHRVRFACLAIHRRFGKSVLAINELIDECLTCEKPNCRAFYMAQTYRQCKSIAWDYVKQFTRNIPGMKYSETELTATFPLNIMMINGEEVQSQAKLSLLGSDQYDSHRGIYCDALVIDEWGNQAPAAWREVFRPALSDRKGWVIFLGTPNGKNHFYDTYREGERNDAWFVKTYRADETGIIDKEELQSMKDTMGEDEYRQEMLCDWSAAVRGTFYASQMQRAKDEKRICRVPHEQRLPVIASFDLGIDDFTAIWFVQFFNSEIRLIEYREFQNTGLLEVMHEIESEFRHFSIPELWMPWDINVREMMTGRTRLETLEDQGYRVDVAPKLSLPDGINAVRSILSKCWFDSWGTSIGIDCLENYRKKTNPRNGEFMDTPVHDKFSHGADAFRTIACLYQDNHGGSNTFLSSNRIVRRNYKPQVKRSAKWRD